MVWRRVIRGRTRRTASRGSGPGRPARCRPRPACTCAGRAGRDTGRVQAADGGLPGLDPREARRALLGLAGAVVEVHLLIRAPSRPIIWCCSLISCGLRWLPTWPGSRVRRATTPSPTCAATWPGVRPAAWTRWPRAGCTWSCTSGGCRRSAGSSPPPSRDGSRWQRGFYRTCVIDSVLEHSPAEHIRRPAVPAESPTPGFTHLQFEALLSVARESPNPCDFALMAMLGLLGLRIFETTSADIADLGEEHGHRVLRVRQRHQGRTDPAASGRRAGYRSLHRRAGERPDPAQRPRCPHGPARRDPPPAAPGPHRWC
jgi:hypothetical protein